MCGRGQVSNFTPKTMSKEIVIDWNEIEFSVGCGLQTTAR